METNILVQHNGKFIGKTFSNDSDTSLTVSERAMSLISEETIAKIIKVVCVPDKLVNFVTRN